MNISGIVKNTTKFVSDNSPTILTGIAVGGVVTTAILAARGGGPAYKDIHNAEFDKGAPLSFVEKTKLTYKHYIPAGLVAGGTIVALVAAHTTSSNRVAAAMGAYSILENSYREFREKAVEIHGENKVAKIRQEIAQDHMDANPPKPSEIFITGKGEALFRDEHTKRYFKSDMNTIDALRNEINEVALNDMYVSLNDWYRLIGLDPISHGDDFGWKPERERWFDIIKDTAITPDGEPCITLDYEIHNIRNI